jgi:hypothetical protein
MLKISVVDGFHTDINFPNRLRLNLSRAVLGFANALYIERQLGTMRYGWKPKRVRELIPSESVHVNLSRLPACWTVMSVPFTPDPESIERVVAHSF